LSLFLVTFDEQNKPTESSNPAIEKKITTIPQDKPPVPVKATEAKKPLIIIQKKTNNIIQKSHTTQKIQDESGVDETLCGVLGVAVGLNTSIGGVKEGDDVIVSGLESTTTGGGCDAGVSGCNIFGIKKNKPTESSNPAIEKKITTIPQDKPPFPVKATEAKKLLITIKKKTNNIVSGLESTTTGGGCDAGVSGCNIFGINGISCPVNV
jgi:hypothetical protein